LPLVLRWTGSLEHCAVRTQNSQNDRCFIRYIPSRDSSYNIDVFLVTSLDETRKVNGYETWLCYAMDLDKPNVLRESLPGLPQPRSNASRSCLTALGREGSGVIVTMSSDVRSRILYLAMFSLISFSYKLVFRYTRLHISCRCCLFEGT
jgi:hypothetical protein